MSLGTFTEGIENTLESARRMKDTTDVRRTMAQLEHISLRFERLIFEPNGIRALVLKYLDNPNDRGTWAAIQDALNHSQDVYRDAQKTLKISDAFQARHPELMKALGTYLRAKEHILSGIGTRVTRPSEDAELKALRELEPLFDRVNAGVRKARQDIADLLREFDRNQSRRK